MNQATPNKAINTRTNVSQDAILGRKKFGLNDSAKKKTPIP
jgi:hypothetical protein